MFLSPQLAHSFLSAWFHLGPKKCLSICLYHHSLPLLLSCLSVAGFLFISLFISVSVSSLFLTPSNPSLSSSLCGSRWPRPYPPCPLPLFGLHRSPLCACASSFPGSLPPPTPPAHPPPLPHHSKSHLWGNGGEELSGKEKPEQKIVYYFSAEWL